MFEEILARLRPKIIERPLPYNWRGAYDRKTHTIYLQPGLPPVHRRSTLAHEAAHAALGHMGQCTRQERAAEELAASWLITFCAYMRAGQIHDSAPGLSYELDVLPRDIHAYARYLEAELSRGRRHRDGVKS